MTLTTEQKKKAIESFKPAAAWTDDCQGKKDYDGRLIDISCRYYPPSKNVNGKHSCFVGLLLRHTDNDRFLDLNHAELWGDDEATLKRDVELWIETRSKEILRAILVAGAFVGEQGSVTVGGNNEQIA